MAKREYQRTCRTCGKVWHSLASRERQLKGNEFCSNCDVVGQGCGCNPSAQLQAQRNLEASQSELSRLQRCPNCGSSNYYEKIV